MAPRVRILRWCLLPLLLGLMTTVAVAWGLAAWLPQKSWNESRIGSGNEVRGKWLFMREYRTSGGVRRSWGFEELHSRRHHPYIDAIEDPAGLFESPHFDQPDLWPQWGTAHALRDDPTLVVDDGMEHATGWPVLTAWYGVSNTYVANAPQPRIDGGIPLPIENAPPNSFLLDAHQIRSLPLHPIWPGLIINTLFYAALWLIPLTTLRAARRHQRRRHNRCPTCAYDLNGLTPNPPHPLKCPECGHAY